MNKDKAEENSDMDYLYRAVMADTEALEDAKMTLEIIKKTDPDVYDEMINDSISLIAYALSHPILSVIERMVGENQKPVAYAHLKSNALVRNLGGIMGRHNYQPLYAAPQKKEWVNLTDEEIRLIRCDFHGSLDTNAYGRAIQNKIKEKNNG